MITLPWILRELRVILCALSSQKAESSLVRKLNKIDDPRLPRGEFSESRKR